MTPQIPRAALIEAIDAALHSAQLPSDDVARLREVGRTATRVVYGTHSVRDCGCPLTQAGLWNDADYARLGRSFDRFWGKFDRVMRHYPPARVLEVVE